MEGMRSMVLPVWAMLMVFLALINFSLSVTSKEVEDICSSYQVPQFCTQALNSDPRTAGADLKELAQIAIDLSKKNATATVPLIASLLKQATDDALKERYRTCALDYDLSLTALGTCADSVSSGDFHSLHEYASAVIDNARVCLINLKESGPPADPSQLPSKTEDLIDLTAIIVVIAHRLIG